MNYDAIVIGAGQAGPPLAYAMADKGWKVALIERGELGGTCVNNGCTPTKTLVHRAQVAHYARNSSRWGVETQSVKVDLSKIVEQKNAVVRHSRDYHRDSIEERKTLDLLKGTARFLNATEVEVDRRKLTSDKIFLNTGARPAIPKIPGLDETPYLTNENIMDLTEVPENLIVLGGGYVGLEFAQMYSRFGSKVTVLQSSGQIAPREDPEIAEELQKALESEGIEFVLNAKIEKIGQGVEVWLQGGQTLRGSHLLVATGRTPNTEGLQLGNAGVETDERGYIPVNGRLETNVPGIWALGDVNGGPAFTHISYNDYQIVSGNLLEGKDISTAERIVSYCMFTDPQLGGLGMTEKEARAKGYRLKIGKAPMSWVSRARERDEMAGSMKLVVDASNDKILGATILGVEGGEVVQLLGTTMLAGVPYTSLKKQIFIHPTLAEGLFFLVEEVKPVE